MEGSATGYPLVLDLTSEVPVSVERIREGLERRPSVDPNRIASELKDISDAIAPVLAKSELSAGFGLQTIELSLTIGAEGGIWFVAKGSAEASITATFGRPG